MVMPTARVIIVSGAYVLVETIKNSNLQEKANPKDPNPSLFYIIATSDQDAARQFNDLATGHKLAGKEDIHFSWDRYTGSQIDQTTGQSYTHKALFLKKKLITSPQAPGGEVNKSESPKQTVVRELKEEIGTLIDQRFFHDAGNHGGIHYFTMQVEDTQGAREAFTDRWTALGRGTEIYGVDWQPLTNHRDLARIYGQIPPSNVVTEADIQNSMQVTAMCGALGNTAGVCSGGGGSSSSAQGCGGGGCSSSARPGGRRRSTRRRRALRKTRKAYI